MSDCRFGVSPVNYPDPDPDSLALIELRYFPFLMDRDITLNVIRGVFTVGLLLLGSLRGFIIHIQYRLLTKDKADILSDTISVKLNVDAS